MYKHEKRILLWKNVVTDTIILDLYLTLLGRVVTSYADTIASYDALDLMSKMPLPIGVTVTN